LIKKLGVAVKRSSVDGETIEIQQEKQAMNELGVIIILLSIKTTARINYFCLQIHLWRSFKMLMAHLCFSSYARLAISNSQFI
jgi:hypothetical protein